MLYGQLELMRLSIDHFELTFFGVGGKRGRGVTNYRMVSTMSLVAPAEEHLPIL